MSKNGLKLYFEVLMLPAYITATGTDDKAAIIRTLWLFRNAPSSLILDNDCTQALGLYTLMGRSIVRAQLRN